MFSPQTGWLAFTKYRRVWPARPAAGIGLLLSVLLHQPLQPVRVGLPQEPGHFVVADSDAFQQILRAARRVRSIRRVDPALGQVEAGVGDLPQRGRAGPPGRPIAQRE